MSDSERRIFHKDKKQEPTMDKPSQPWEEWPSFKRLMAKSREVPHPGTVTVRIFPNPRRNKVEKIEPEKK